MAHPLLISKTFCAGFTERGEVNPLTGAHACASYVVGFTRYHSGIEAADLCRTMSVWYLPGTHEADPLRR